MENMLEIIVRWKTAFNLARRKNDSARLMSMYISMQNIISDLDEIGGESWLSEFFEEIRSALWEDCKQSSEDIAQALLTSGRPDWSKIEDYGEKNDRWNAFSKTQGANPKPDHRGVG